MSPDRSTWLHTNLLVALLGYCLAESSPNGSSEKCYSEGSVRPPVSRKLFCYLLHDLILVDSSGRIDDVKFTKHILEYVPI